MDFRPLTQHERNALLEFEVVYDRWREATDAWLAAEVLLWTNALAGAGPGQVAQLGEDAARLRDGARAAYLGVINALMHTLPH